MPLPKWKLVARYGADLLRHLPDPTDMACVEIDEEGVIQYVNPLASQCWGWKLGMPLPGDLLIALQDVKDETSVALPVMAGGLYLRGVKTPAQKGWLLIGHAAESSIETESQSDFRSLIEKIPICIFRMQSDGEIIFANAAAEKTTGYNVSEIVGAAFWLDAVHPEDRWKLTEAMRCVFDEGKVEVRLRILTRQQTMRQVSMHLFATEDETQIEGVVVEETTHVEAEATLLQEEALYKTFLEQAPIGMVHLDATGMVTFENHPFRQIVGEAPEEAWLGLSIFEHPALEPGFQAQVAGLLEEGRAFQGIPISLPARGETKHLLIHGSPIQYIEDEIIGGVLMIEDVTVQRQREEELMLRNRYERAESALRGITMTAPDEPMFMDMAAPIMGQAIRAERLHLLMHSTATDACVSRGRWPWALQQQQAMAVKEGAFPALERVSKQGGLLHLHQGNASAEEQALLDLTGAEEALWVPFYDGKQRVGYVLCERMENTIPWTDQEVVQVNQLVRVFETLWSWIQVSNRYRITVSTIEDSLFNYTFIDEDQRHYLFVTDQIEPLTGYPARTVLNSSTARLRWLQDVVHPADREKVNAHDERLRAGQEGRILYRIQHRTGDIRWLREDATPHQGRDGSLVISGILSDVTEQKRAEEMQHEARRDAEASNQLKTAFIATLSHEIRTPLGAVGGYAQLLAHEFEEMEQSGIDLPEPLHEFTQAIDEGSKKLMDLVNNLFDLSSAEMGTVTVQRIPLPLHGIVSQIVEEVAPALKEKAVDLVLDLDPGNPVIVGDPRRIRQVLHSLISNAVKFTMEGGVTVRTRHRQHEVEIEVIDTGVGIAETYLNKVFQPFTQEEDWLDRRFEGSGLGLALTRRLLDLLGGRIEVESRKEQGSLFRVYLPAARQTPVISKRRGVRLRPNSLENEPPTTNGKPS